IPAPIHDSPNRNAALVIGANVGLAVETAKIITTVMAANRAWSGTPTIWHSRTVTSTEIAIPRGTEGNDIEVEDAYGRSNQCSDKSKSCRSKCIFRRYISCRHI